jgi:hypothetical protein
MVSTRNNKTYLNSTITIFNSSRQNLIFRNRNLTEFYSHNKIIFDLLPTAINLNQNPLELLHLKTFLMIVLSTCCELLFRVYYHPSIYLHTNM